MSPPRPVPAWVVGWVLGWVGAVLAAGLVRAPEGTSGPAAHMPPRETVEA
jgi:hypothetical protein